MSYFKTFDPIDKYKREKQETIVRLMLKTKHNKYLEKKQRCPYITLV